MGELIVPFPLTSTSPALNTYKLFNNNTKSLISGIWQNTLLRIGYRGMLGIRIGYIRILIGIGLVVYFIIHFSFLFNTSLVSLFYLYSKNHKVSSTDIDNLPLDKRISPELLPNSNNRNDIITWLTNHPIAGPLITEGKIIINVYDSLTPIDSGLLKANGNTPGLYLFFSSRTMNSAGKLLLVGETTWLYQRVMNYFCSSHLKRRRPALYYLRAFGYKNIELFTISIKMSDSESYILRTTLETEIIRNFDPFLNIRLASPAFNVTNMNAEERSKIRSSTVVYLYCSNISSVTDLTDLTLRQPSLMFSFASIAEACRLTGYHPYEFKAMCSNEESFTKAPFLFDPNVPLSLSEIEKRAKQSSGLYYFTSLKLEDSGDPLWTESFAIEWFKKLRYNAIRTKTWKSVIGLNIIHPEQSKIWNSIFECSISLNCSRDTISTWALADKCFDYSEIVYQMGPVALALRKIGARMDLILTSKKPLATLDDCRSLVLLNTKNSRTLKVVRSQWIFILFKR